MAVIKLTTVKARIQRAEICNIFGATVCALTKEVLDEEARGLVRAHVGRLLIFPCWLQKEEVAALKAFADEDNNQ